MALRMQTAMNGLLTFMTSVGIQPDGTFSCVLRAFCPHQGIKYTYSELAHFVLREQKGPRLYQVAEYRKHMHQSIMLDLGARLTRRCVFWSHFIHF